MKIYNQLINKLKDQRGGVAIIVAIILFFVLIGMMALAIDVGRLYATKNELQNVADAAALAGAGKLGQIYSTLTAAEQDTHNFSNDRQTIVDSIQDVVEAGNNKVAGEDLTIADGDIFIYNVTLEGGNLKYDSLDDHFVLGVPSTMPDAVRVIVRRDSSVNNPISTFFTKLWGYDTIDVLADATAALTTLDEVGPGKMNMPVGLSESWFDPPHCEDTIAFSPTPSSCAGWHNFFDPINANAMSNKLLGFILDDPTVHDDILNNDPDPYGDCVEEPCGRTDPADTLDVSWIDYYFNMNPGQIPDAAYTMGVDSGVSFFEFQGGTISSLFNGGKLAWEADPNDPYHNLVVPTYNIPGDSTSGQVVLDDDKHPAPFFAIFDYFRFRDEIDIGAGISVDTDGDGTDDKTFTDSDAVWSGLVPVYKDPNPCINPNTALEIVGFAIIHVVMPNGPPDSTILAKIDCNLTFIGGQGGGGFSGNVRGTIPNLVE